MNQQYPKLEDLPSSQVKFIDFLPNIDKAKLKQVTQAFFEFYGNDHGIECKVISVDVGRWQNRELDKNQTNFTLAERRYVSSLGL